LVPANRRDKLADGYESLTEGLSRTPPAELAGLVQALAQFLSGPGWQQRLRQARQQLDAPAHDGPVAPLADLVAAPGASTLVESLRRVDAYLAQGKPALAMEEAFYAIAQSPGYLPIHLRVADILLAESRTDAAMDKLSAVAATYQARGDVARAARTLRQVLRQTPLDVDKRAWLIELLVAQGHIDEALQQYSDLADTHYQLADLDSAYTAHTAALQLAQQHHRGTEVAVKLLHKLGDIDLQRLNWRGAQTTYAHICQLAPDDHAARATLIDLLFRLGNNRQALGEVDGYVRHLLGKRNTMLAVNLLNELVESMPSEMSLVGRLARLYQDLGRRDDAITQYDLLGELQLQAGQTTQAAETIRTILALNPPEASSYEALLAELQAT
jgi:tetratricopeptide (TPR) repeat protein